MQLYQGDCLEVMRHIPDKSVDLVLTDPPYNIGVQTQRGCKRQVNRWDRIDHYIEWCIEWLLECQRLLTSNGVLYLWHNDMAQIAELLCQIRARTNLAFVSFCIWDKGDAYRANAWSNRVPGGKTSPRSWFNRCEYCLHFFNASQDADRSWRYTGLERINNNPACYLPIKDWYRAEMERLGLTNTDISKAYTAATGRKPHMLRHYFKDSQFEIPTREVFESVYEPHGFCYTSGGRQGYEAMRQDYEAMRQDYEAMRQDYEAMRNVHNCDAKHCNVWQMPPIPSNNRLHTCQKPVPLLERLIRVSSREGSTVLDCFMGSGSTGVAALHTGREFIGVELDEGYFEIAKRRIEEAQS